MCQHETDRKIYAEISVDFAVGFFWERITAYRASPFWFTARL
jgi:hypothetical protein